MNLVVAADAGRDLMSTSSVIASPGQGSPSDSEVLAVERLEASPGCQCGRASCAHMTSSVLWSRSTASDIVEVIETDVAAGKMDPAEAVEIDRVWARATPHTLTSISDVGVPRPTRSSRPA